MIASEATLAVRLSEADLAHVCSALEEAMGHSGGGPLTALGAEQVVALHARLEALYRASFSGACGGTGG